MKRRILIGGAIAALIAAAGPLCAAQGDYPNRPIRFIVPYAVGGTSDLVGRLVGAKLGEELGVHMVVDNRGGAGGTLGAQLTIEANPDGYTILVHNIALAVNETLRPKRGYVVLRDMAPISIVGYTPSVLIVNNNLPYKSIQDFVTAAKAAPGKIAFGSAGAGSSTHLSMAYFMSIAKINLHHVPYKGGGPAVRDAIAGHVQCVMVPIPTVFGHIQAKRLRPLGVSGARRSPVLPDLPTIAEAGVPGYEFNTWYVLMAPAKTPKAILAKLNQAANRGLKDPALREKLLNTGLDPQPSTPEALRKLIQDETARWKKVIEEAGIPKV